MDILLIPSSYVYESELFYEQNTLDQIRKKKANDPFDKDFWVYTNYNEKKGTMDKRDIKYLENKHYVAAIMSIPYDSDWKTPKEIKEKEMYKNFQNFLQGKGPMPKLKEIYKKIRKIGDEERFDLQENIENSITLHWIYIHRDRLEDIIIEYV